MTTKYIKKKQYVTLFIWTTSILMLVLAFMPHKAEASAKYVAKISTLKQNTWSLQKDSDYNYDYSNDDYTYTYTDYYWKITVPADGYLKIQVNSSKNNPEINIYKKVKATFSKSPYDYNEGGIERTHRNFKSTVTVRQVLEKGTYYLQGTRGIKYRWSFIKVKNPNTLNYCKFRAKTVKSGVKQSILINHGYEYSRWFKVVLPKKKAITITLESLDKEYWDSNGYGDFTVYKDNGDYVNCPSLTDKTFRTPILPKGTYYVRIRPDIYEESMTGKRLFSFSWK